MPEDLCYSLVQSLYSQSRDSQVATVLSHRARIRGQNRFYLMDPETLWIHKLSHSESSGNHAVKIYAQCMNYRIYAKILNSLST